MKHYITFLLILVSYASYCQESIELGDKCFNEGDYTCAEIKYKESNKLASAMDKPFIEIKIQRAKWCSDHLKIADQAFTSLNYPKAKENYLAILDSNPKDEYTKSQIEKCKEKINEVLSQEGDNCFNEGNYSCAVTKYNELKKSAISEIDKQTADINIQRAMRCSEHSIIADQAYTSLNYTKAKENYKVVLDLNPKDSYAKSKIEKCKVKIDEAANPVFTLSKKTLSFKSSGGREKIYVNTNLNSYTTEKLPYWCTVQKYSNYFEVNCNEKHFSGARAEYFFVKAGDKTIRVDVKQQGIITQNNKSVTQTKSNQTSQTYNSKPSKKYRPKLRPFSSLGFQSGEIAKYGLLYESGGKRTVGFHMSFRSSFTSEEDILNGVGTENKTEADLGLNFKLSNRIYLNIGAGYGYYDKIFRNDYAGTLTLEKTGYLLATSGLMIRISNIININGGVSFMNIDNEFYKPEITFGVSFNLKKKKLY